MTNIDYEALEDLLRHSSPRPVPSQEDEVVVREAVHAEWRELTARRRTRRRISQYAIAATVLLGAFLAFNSFRTPVIDIVQVATIEKSVGPVYLLGEQAELRETGDLSNVMAGQTIVTGDNAGLALAWGHGGSIRVDEHTRIQFMDDQAIFLESGRVYFDSQSSALVAGITAGDSPEFTLRTEHGTVQHVGTQFMTEVEANAIVVSVREGEVAVSGTRYDFDASAGQQVTLTGTQQPSVLSIGSYGAAWDWIGRSMPPVDVHGQTLHDFLTWVCREMGLELRFEGRAEAIADIAVLKGTINTEPAEALRLRLATAALEWRIDEGVIYISDDS